VKPGGTIATHVHRMMDEHELVLGSALLLQGSPVTRGTAFHWPHHFPHRYDNPSEVEQTVLCIDSPPFTPSDEVEVEVPLADLPPVVGRMYYPSDDAAL
jgi:dihydroneopterin aldolase